MLSGKVAWFSGPKSYGFITPDDGGKDIFVYFSAIQMDGYKTLKEGQKVTYDVEMGEKGKLQACNVVVVK